jgi:hypothetical protein
VTCCPTSECFVDAGHELDVTTPTELLDALCRLVDGAHAHGRCYFVVEAPDAHRYVQGLVTDDRVLEIESVSNESLGKECAEEHGLTDADHARLVRLGWLPPDERSPNWHREIVEPWPWPASMAAELLTRTLHEVHRAEPAKLEVIVGHAAGSARRPVDDG